MKIFEVTCRYRPMVKYVIVFSNDNSLHYCLIKRSLITYFVNYLQVLSINVKLGFKISYKLNATKSNIFGIANGNM